MASVRGELGFTRVRWRGYETQESEIKSMFPYYNTGVLFLPWDCGLREAWEDHIRKIKDLFSEQDEAWRFVGESNQAGFATVLHLLRGGGLPFVRLEYPFNANYLHIYKGPLSVGEIKLFHAFGFGKRAKPGSEVFHRAVYQYRRDLGGTMYRQWEIHLRETRPVKDLVRYLIPSAVRVLRLTGLIQDMYHRHVEKAL